MGGMKSYYIYVRKQCPRRSLDTSRLALYFEKNGLKPAKKPRYADIILVYTCGGFNNAEKESLLTIKKSLSYDAVVVVTGCLLKINPSGLQGMKLILPENLDVLDGLIGARVKLSSVKPVSSVGNVNNLLGSRPNLWER